MIKQNMDKRSMHYLKYLRKRYELEKQILRERAEYDPDNPDSTLALLKKRTKALGDLGQKYAELGKIGLGQIIPSHGGILPPTPSPGDILPPEPTPQDIHPPYVVPWQHGYYDEICDLYQVLNLENATYIVLDSDPDFNERQLSAKSVYSQASADPHWADDSGMIQNGYRTIIKVPASENVTFLTIKSVLSAYFIWVEANAIGNGWVSHVSAHGLAWLSGPSEFVSASPVTLISLTATDGQVLPQNYCCSITANAVFELRTSVPPGSGATIQVFETVMLNAMTPNGHAWIEGEFSWKPLGVTMREGCRVVQIPRLWPWP